MQTRLIGFADNTLTLNFKGDTAAKVIDLLYRHVAEGQPGSSYQTYNFEDDAVSDLLKVQRGQETLYQGTDAGLAGELLLSDSCYQLAAQCHNGLLFHAAALLWQGHGLILPGASGAGKSTLTAWLVCHGFDYLSDELAFIPWQTRLIKPFTRPINLKSPARSVLNGLFDFDTNRDDILSSPYGDFVPPRLLGASKLHPEAQLNSIIFPQYRPGSDFKCSQLSKAQAGLALMETLINACNLPEHGFQEVTRLARQVPAYALHYSNFNQIAEYIKDICSS